jgi:hypothetical protein
MIVSSFVSRTLLISGVITVERKPFAVEFSGYFAVSSLYFNALIFCT